MFSGLIARIRVIAALPYAIPLLPLWLKLSMGSRSRFVATPDSAVDLGRVRLADNVRISVVGGTLLIGEDVFFNRNCTVVCKDKVTIGSGCLFGPGVAIYDHNHLFDSKTGVDACHYVCKPISIGKGCWIGSNTTVLAGATLGDGCVVSAGSIVKGNIPSHSIVSSATGLTIRPIEDR